jgi:hypothetical protein
MTLPPQMAFAMLLAPRARTGLYARSKLAYLKVGCGKHGNGSSKDEE